jgi:hypothetical protein
MPHTTALESTLNERLGYPSEQLKDMLLKMHLTRFFEDAAFQQYSLGNVHGTMHLYAGQEAVAIGAIAALRPDDAITSTHRGHGHAIAKGQDINTMMAELLAKETGVCRGRGGSMHGRRNLAPGRQRRRLRGILLPVGPAFHPAGTDQCICRGDGAQRGLPRKHQHGFPLAAGDLPVRNNHGAPVAEAGEFPPTSLWGYGIPGDGDG